MRWLKKALGLVGRDRALTLVTDGFILAKDHKLDEAARKYADAVDADDTLKEAHLNLALCRLDLYNRDAKALDDATKRVRLDAIAQGLERALALSPVADAAADVAPDPKELDRERLAALAAWRALARVSERRHDPRRAQQAWQQVLEHLDLPGPDRVEAENALKDASRRAALDDARERAAAALAAAEDAADDPAALVAAHDTLSRLVDDAAAPADALPDFRPARAYALLAALAKKSGDLPRAKEHLDRAHATLADDDDPDLVVDIARDTATVCLESADLKAALQASLRAYRARPTDAGLVCNVGVCHLALGDRGQAAEFIDLAARLDPQDPIVKRARAALKDAG
jgi:tetratricopeptide (TPR) repeat protein